MQPLYTTGTARIGGALPVAEPDYARYIPKNKLRRMDRLTRLALHTAHSALEEAGVSMVDGVIMGVGQTTSSTLDSMLRKMIAQQEGLTNPTSFMNSLLSTAAGQIALQLACEGYTNTHSQRGFSVEAALLDASLQLGDNPGQSFVVGGLDVTHDSYEELSINYGHFSANKAMGVERRVGEGAATFVVTGLPTHRATACIRQVYTAYLPEASGSQTPADPAQALFANEFPAVDLILSGRPAGNEAQNIYDQLLAKFSANVPVINYKLDTGEFPTASAHGLHMAVQKLNDETVEGAETQTNRILIINNYGERYYSAILVTRP
jgi:hypothetical protein